ncbi:MAG: glycine--tRNA ligase subunit beta [Acidobacteriota bacterium]
MSAQDHSKTGGELLLEVRSEEIPARMLAPAVRELAHRLFEDLTTRGCAPKEVETGCTPRRMTVVIRGLAAREPDREETVLGPPAQAAFDGDGQPRPAAVGFAKRYGLAPEDLLRVDTDKGERVAAVARTEGRPIAEVLGELVPRALAELRWPKTMRWGSGTGPWVRPVHGLLALFDGEVVPMELFGVPSGNTTVGHPVLSPEAFAVTDAQSYRQALADRGLVLRLAERRERLLEQLKAQAREAGGSLVADDELLDRLTAMVAIPGVITGHFDSGHLVLPREVLIASLRDHQSAFTVEDEKGDLLPVFLTVMDRPDDPIGRVCSGNEWVVAARLEDARFFYREDRKQALSDRALDRLTFHVQLGSYADKVARVETLAAALGRRLQWGDDEISAAAAAARSLKADLVTEMVGEFASLQGLVGGIYLREDGAPEAVWQAVYDQYLPASTEDPLPRGAVGKLVAVADRLDTLAGFFGLGEEPKGSRDPFGLRRAAQGVARILMEGDLPLRLEDALEDAFAAYPDGTLPGDTAPASDRLGTFFGERLRYLLGRGGFAHDEIEAALAAGGEDLPRLARRVESVRSIRGEKDFLSVALAAKRIANILKKAEDEGLASAEAIAGETEVDASLFEHDAEGQLSAAENELADEVREAEAGGDYLEALRHIGRLAPSLERFFDEVLVMAKEEAVRANRIALLGRLHRLISGIAHLDQLVVDKAEERERAGA